MRMKTLARILPVLSAIAVFSPEAIADDYTGWQSRYPEWKLVFSDDFNGSALDTSKWNRIDYVNWNVADWRKHQSRDAELVTVNGDGTVSLWGKYGNYTSQTNQAGGANTYACGGIFTDKTFTFQYGYVEVRAKFDCATGAWPAIWMMPTAGPWPQTGEIDIMEHLNYQGIIYQTIHLNNSAGNHISTTTVKGNGTSSAYFTTQEDKAAFHTYGVEWTEQAVTFYMDGRATLTCNYDPNNPNWPFNKENNPYYLLLDMQLGGSWVGDIGDIGDGVAMTIDYVRVYSEASIPEPSNATLSLLALAGLSARRRRR